MPVVVAAGYIGIELAEALPGRGLDVMLVEMAPEPMSTLDPDMGGDGPHGHERLGHYHSLR